MQCRLVSSSSESMFGDKFAVACCSVVRQGAAWAAWPRECTATVTEHDG